MKRLVISIILCLITTSALAYTTIKLRNDTTANWQTANPILAKGEMGLESVAGNNWRIKVGDGVTRWNSLAYQPKIAFGNISGGITKAQVGLGNVDNTSDINKPVSTSQQTALDLKKNKAFRGCLAYSSQSITGSGVLTWQYSVYDTDNIHNTSVNTERLTVPAGVSKVKLSAHVYDTQTRARGFYIMKNGDYFDGGAHIEMASTVNQFNGELSTAVVSVNPGDYFTVYTSYGAQANATASQTWFAMEIIE